MKHISAIFLFSAMVGFAFVLPKKPMFHEFFQYAYEQSFKGLDKLKDESNGKWSFSQGVGDFNKCEVRYDVNKGLHCLYFYMDLESAGTGKQMSARVEGQIDQMLSAENYRRVQNKPNGEDKDLVRLEYYSNDVAEKAKFPAIEMEVVGNDISAQLIIRLYEPITKN